MNYFPYLIASKADFLLRAFGEIEDSIIKNKKKNRITKPIYILGCPRSGTTLLTHILSNSKQLGYFQYKDFPFYRNIYFWSKINKLYYFGLKKQRRPHGDDLLIDQLSPDSFEEVFWSKNLKNYYDNKIYSLDNNAEVLRLENLYKVFINKLLFVKKASRYLTKNNYNILRIELLKKITTAPKFLICFRNPILTAKSMEKVNNIFVNKSQKDNFFDKKLNFMCHFEFGNQKRPLRLSKEGYEKTEYFWRKNKIYEGYLQQWIDIYSYLLNHVIRKDYNKENIMLVDHTKVMFEEKYLEKIFSFCDLENFDYDTKIIKNEMKVNYFSNLEKKAEELYKQLQLHC